MIPGHVYFALLENGALKVGFTAAADFRWRVASLRSKYGRFELIGLAAGTAATERGWHKRLSRWLVRRSPTGRSEEVFAPPAHIIDEIRSNYGEELREFLIGHGRDAGFYKLGFPESRKWRKSPAVNPFANL
jgi:hypothetical protein